MNSPWIDASDFGATGSEYETLGRIQAGSNRLTVENPGDFQPGQCLTAEGCFFHTYGMIYNDKAPYFAKNQRKLTDELEISGDLDHPGNHQVFIIHFFEDDIFSWMAVDPRYQTGRRDQPVIHRYWIWQGENLPVSGQEIELLDGVRIRFRKTGWKKGESISFHVRNRLRAEITAIHGKVLELDRTANRDCTASRVRHESNEALQNALDSAIREKKPLLIPAGRHRLTDGLWIRHASVRIEGASRVHTVLDVSEADTACFWIAGGNEVSIRNLSMTGHTGYMELPATASWKTATGYGFWPTANQQMEIRGCAAVNAVSTEHLLFEDLNISRMASEAIYLHGSDRTGRPPYIQAPHEGIPGLDRQYQKTCVIHRCNGVDCGFNLFNNNDLAEDTVITECRAERIGNFCENASEFSRFANNHIIDGAALTICSKGNAVISGNVFESGASGRGVCISAGNVIFENNLIKNSLESPIWISGNGPVLIRGNLIDLTSGGGNSGHIREGMVISAQNVLISDNRIEGGGESGTAGFRITENADHLTFHHNEISGCDTAFLPAERSWNQIEQKWEWHPVPLTGRRIVLKDNQLYDCKTEVKEQE